MSKKYNLSQFLNN